MGCVAVPVDAREVLPHAGRMVLVRNVVRHDAQGTVCDIEISRSSMFLEADGVPAWVGLEYMAQSVGAHAGMVARGLGEPVAIGFLLGSRKVDVYTQHFPVGQILHVSVQPVWGEGELFSFDCVVRDARDSRTLVAARLNLYRPRDVARFRKEKGI